MGTITLIGCLAAAVVGFTQLYKGIAGAVEEVKKMRKEKEESKEV